MRKCQKCTRNTVKQWSGRLLVITKLWRQSHFSFLSRWDKTCIFMARRISRMWFIVCDKLPLLLWVVLLWFEIERELMQTDGRINSGVVAIGTPQFEVVMNLAVKRTAAGFNTRSCVCTWSVGKLAHCQIDDRFLGYKNRFCRLYSRARWTSEMFLCFHLLYVYTEFILYRQFKGLSFLNYSVASRTCTYVSKLIMSSCNRGRCATTKFPRFFFLPLSTHSSLHPI